MRAQFVRPASDRGPFEPGTVTLDVRVGQILRGRCQVTIREGGWATFPPRPFTRER